MAKKPSKSIPPAGPRIQAQIDAIKKAVQTIADAANKDSTGHQCDKLGPRVAAILDVK